MRFRTGFIIAVLSIALPLSMWDCSGERTERREDAAEERAPAASAVQAGALPRGLVLRTIDGKKIPVSDYAGELVLMNFWATWSNKSRELIGIMNALHPRYSKRFHFLAVCMDTGGIPAVRSFIRENAVAGDVIVNGREVADAFGGIGTLPATLLIARDGSVEQRLKGLHRREQYEKLLTFYGMSAPRDR